MESGAFSKALVTTDRKWDCSGLGHGHGTVVGGCVGDNGSSCDLRTEWSLGSSHASGLFLPFRHKSAVATRSSFYTRTLSQGLGELAVGGNWGPGWILRTTEVRASNLPW